MSSTGISTAGTLGRWHIGIYTRLLLMFLIDQRTQPSALLMSVWIWPRRRVQKTLPLIPRDVLTYLEVIWLLYICIGINPFRWEWFLFVFFGFSFMLPKNAPYNPGAAPRNGTGLRRASVRHDLGYPVGGQSNGAGQPWWL
jgi:hypothetical protein